MNEKDKDESRTQAKQKNIKKLVILVIFKNLHCSKTKNKSSNGIIIDKNVVMYIYFLYYFNCMNYCQNQICNIC